MTFSKKIVWVFSLILCALLWQLGSWGVTDTSEARYAEMSREMLASGNWVMPNLLGIFHFDKPLFVYWITALGMKLFGVNAFGARFFLQIAYLIQIYLVYKIALELFLNQQKAIFSAAIYAGLPIVIISIRALTIDAYLNTLELTAVLFLVLYFRQNRVGMLYLYFIFLGLAVFAKGPIGLIMPVLMIYPIRKITQVQGRKNGLHIVLGIVLTLLIGGWWFAYLLMKSPDFYHFLIGEQLVNRMMKAGEMKRAEPFWFYLAYFSAAMVPFVFLLPQAIWQGVKRRETVVIALALFGLMIPLLFFSCSSSKLLLYVLPLSPYVAMVCGWFADEADERTIGNYHRLVFWVFGVLFLGLLGLFLGLIPDFSYTPSLAAWVLWSLGVLYLFFFKRKKKKLNLVALSLLFPLFITPISADIMSKSESEINSTAPIARFLKENKLEDRKIIVWNYRLSSISFELQKDIYSVKWDHYSLFRHTEFQENDRWKQNLIDINNDNEALYLRSLVTASSILIAKDEIPERFNWILTQYHHVKHIGKWGIYY